MYAKDAVRARPVVLVAEDDEGLNEVIAGYLRRRGFAVEQAYEPDGAMDRIVHGHPDMVLMDASLPGGYGPDVLERAAKAGHRPPALVVSADDTLLAPQHGETARIVRRLNKPLPLRMLADFIDAYIAHDRQTG